MDQDRLPNEELENLKGQLRNMLTDKDRLRIIKAVGRNWYLSAKQAADLLSVAQFSGAGVEAGVLLYAKVVDQDNLNDLLAAFRYDEDKQDFLARVRSSADFERQEAPAKPESNLSHPVYVEAKAREAAKKASNAEAVAGIYHDVNSETRGFATTDAVSRPVETIMERVAESKQAAPEHVQVSVAPGTRTFPLAQLQDPNAAAALGIDASLKETYLTDADFSSIFSTSKTAFQSLPKWKKDKLKKDAGLF